MKYCTLCKRYVAPQKKFSWILFILFLGVFYLPYYWLFAGKKYCPICKADKLTQLSPEDAEAKQAEKEERREARAEVFNEIKGRVMGE